MKKPIILSLQHPTPGTDLVRYKAIFAVNTITGISVLT